MLQTKMRVGVAVFVILVLGCVHPIHGNDQTTKPPTNFVHFADHPDDHAKGIITISTESRADDWLSVEAERNLGEADLELLGSLFVSYANKERHEVDDYIDLLDESSAVRPCRSGSCSYGISVPCNKTSETHDLVLVTRLVTRVRPHKWDRRFFPVQVACLPIEDSATLRQLDSDSVVVVSNKVGATNASATDSSGDKRGILDCLRTTDGASFHDHAFHNKRCGNFPHPMLPTRHTCLRSLPRPWLMLVGDSNFRELHKNAIISLVEELKIAADDVEGATGDNPAHLLPLCRQWTWRYRHGDIDCVFQDGTMVSLRFLTTTAPWRLQEIFQSDWRPRKHHAGDEPGCSVGWSQLTGSIAEFDMLMARGGLTFEDGPSVVVMSPGLWATNPNLNVDSIAILANITAPVRIMVSSGLVDQAMVDLNQNQMLTKCHEPRVPIQNVDIAEQASRLRITAAEIGWDFFDLHQVSTTPSTFQKLRPEDGYHWAPSGVDMCLHRMLITYVFAATCLAVVPPQDPTPWLRESNSNFQQNPSDSCHVISKNTQDFYAPFQAHWIQLPGDIDSERQMAQSTAKRSMVGTAPDSAVRQTKSSPSAPPAIVRVILLQSALPRVQHVAEQILPFLPWDEAIVRTMNAVDCRDADAMLRDVKEKFKIKEWPDAQHFKNKLACAASHINAMREAEATGLPTIVLEDDAEIGKDFYEQALEHIRYANEHHSGWHRIDLYHSINVQRHTFDFSVPLQVYNSRTTLVPQHRHNQAVGYIVSPAGGRIIPAEMTLLIQKIDAKSRFAQDGSIISLAERNVIRLLYVTDPIVTTAGMFQSSAKGCTKLGSILLEGHWCPCPPSTTFNHTAFIPSKHLAAEVGVVFRRDKSGAVDKIMLVGKVDLSELTEVDEFHAAFIFTGKRHGKASMQIPLLQAVHVPAIDGGAVASKDALQVPLDLHIDVSKNRNVATWIIEHHLDREPPCSIAIVSPTCQIVGHFEADLVVWDTSRVNVPDATSRAFSFGTSANGASSESAANGTIGDNLPHATTLLRNDSVGRMPSTPVNVGSQMIDGQVQWINILTRTSGRPIFFANNRASVVAQTYPFVHHIVCADDDPSFEYASKHVEGDNNATLVRVHKHTHMLQGGTMVSQRRNPIGRTYHAPHNLHMNELLRHVRPGWVLFLDDDNMLLSNTSASQFMEHAVNKDALLMFKVLSNIIKENPIIPSPECWGKPPKFGCVDAGGYAFHTSYASVARVWDDASGADFLCASALYKALPTTQYIDMIIVKLQEAVYGHGQRRDLGDKVDDKCPMDTVFSVEQLTANLAVSSISVGLLHQRDLNATLLRASIHGEVDLSKIFTVALAVDRRFSVMVFTDVHQGKVAMQVPLLEAVHVPARPGTAVASMEAFLEPLVLDIPLSGQDENVSTWFEEHRGSLDPFILAFVSPECQVVAHIEAEPELLGRMFTPSGQRALNIVDEIEPPAIPSQAKPENAIDMVFAADADDDTKGLITIRLPHPGADVSSMIGKEVTMASAAEWYTTKFDTDETLLLRVDSLDPCENDAGCTLNFLLPCDRTAESRQFIIWVGSGASATDLDCIPVAAGGRMRIIAAPWHSGAIDRNVYVPPEDFVRLLGY